MHPIIDSLKKLSETAREVLPSLERYDYRKEAVGGLEKKLSLDLLPKPLSEIIESLLIYCSPIISRDDNLPRKALLNKQNFQTFIENYNATGDCSLTKQLCHIELEPIKDVAEYLKELGLNNQARLLDNAYEFGIKLRSSNREHQFCQINHDLPPVQIQFTVPSEELTNEEKQDAQQFTQFCSVFAKNSLSLPQIKALYAELKKLAADPGEQRPHLVVMAVIVYLRSQKSLRKPLPDSLNYCRETIFQSLGLDPKKCHTYGDDSLKTGSKTSLLKYKTRAADIVKSALGNTR